ncbi:uncharacterized protein B0H18DRAFT_1085392 [Fomitopsis serialis]|uniref:uncharacterized protein n=1 Tax=Fomitopsis serialis TaxID=139415 RepID=UPI0020086395|nr:uncharacterized protein B0H18DRAFT_1085392 [Neoantrodia serialis]KAH9924703.1 hypothetical protein B0H18DRAFT_1085392 [Neoantrodia serialis]
MLPRHLRAAVVTSSAPAQIRALLYARSSLRPTSLRAHRVISHPPSASFHSSSRRQDEQPRSPFQTFVEVLREELRKNRELQDNVKQLQGDVDKFQDSEAMRKAKAAYERARLTSSIKENPRLRAAAEELRKTGMKVGDAVSEALKTMEESEVMRAISRASAAVSNTIASTTEPIRKTEAYKTLSETWERETCRFEEKEARRKRRQARLAKAGKESITRAVKADPEAGSAMVLHKDSPKNERWERLKETNPVLRSLASLRQAYDESENPSWRMRAVTDTIGGWFEETEQAQVHRRMKLMDPSYSLESFERELREYIIPEVTYNVLWATMEQFLRQGLVSDSKVLDIRQVDISGAKILENDIPVFVVTFQTQEMLIFRNAKTSEIMVGAENKVEQCHYAAVVTRTEEELDNELTGGWKVVEMARRSSRAYL